MALESREQSNRIIKLFGRMQNDCTVLTIQSGNQLIQWEYMKDGKNLVVLQSFKSQIVFISQSPLDSAALGVVCADRSVHLLDLANNRIKKMLFFEQIPTDLQFDPLSTCYMIISFQNGEMAMYELASFEEVRLSSFA